MKVLPKLQEEQQHEEEPMEEASGQLEIPIPSHPRPKLNTHVYFDDDGEIREPPAAAVPSRYSEEPQSRPSPPPSPIGPVPRRVSTNKLKRLKAIRMSRERRGSQSPRMFQFSTGKCNFSTFWP